MKKFTAVLALSVSLLFSTNSFAWGISTSTSGDVMSGAHTSGASMAESGRNGWSMSDSHGSSWNKSGVKSTSCVFRCGGGAMVSTWTAGGTWDGASNSSMGSGTGGAFSTSSQMGWSDGTAKFRTRSMF